MKLVYLQGLALTIAGAIVLLIVMVLYGNESLSRPAIAFTVGTMLLFLGMGLLLGADAQRAIILTEGEQ